MRETTLGSIAQIFDGPHATPTRMDSGPYFLNISSLDNGRLDLAQSDHVSREDYEKWTRRVTPTGGDLLFSYETRLGEAALMPEGVVACLGRRMALLRFDPKQIVPDYFLYHFLSPAFQRKIESRTIHGATVNRIALSSMADWTVRIPGLPEQKAIAEVLGVLDDKIAANRRIAEISGDLLNAEFEALNLDVDVVAGAATRLNEYFDVNPKYSKPSEECPVYVDMQKLPMASMLIDGWDHRVARGGVRFMNGDTLLARITPCLQNRKTGYVDFLDEDQIAVGSTEYIVLRSKGFVPRELSFFLATSHRFRAFAIRHMVGTSGRQRLSASDLEGYPVAIVDQSRLDQWGVRASPIVSRLSIARDESRTLAQLRDTLLPKLMSGEFRIRDAEKVVEAVL